MLLDCGHHRDTTEHLYSQNVLEWEFQIKGAMKKLLSALMPTLDDIGQFASLILNTSLEITGSPHGMVTRIDAASGDHIALGYTDVLSSVDAGCDRPDRITVYNQKGCKTDGIWAQIFRSKKPVVFNDASGRSENRTTADELTPVDSVLAFPVLLAEAVVGHIILINSPEPYRQHHIDFIEQISELYALALQRQQMEDEKISLVSRLQQAQKMEAIGTLAGGIAHDFNNILFPIIGYTEMALCEGIDSETQQKYLAETLKAANRARELVQQILTFSRQDQQEMMPLRVQSIVKEVTKLLRSSFPATIEIRISVDDQCGQVMADPSQIHQILMNLCTNAYHAMRKNGGQLDIGLSEIRVGENDLRYYSDVNPGHYVRLTVSDTGHGMAQHVLERIYDPYFTTKTNGEGSGLGLSVVHGIVKNCGGYISVDSVSGKGTEFSVFFPLISHQSDRPKQTDANQLPMGEETVLLVDDEAQIVDMERQILERLGYTVHSAANGMEALRMFEVDPHRFDLVITDQTMPRMTGLELAERLKAIRSELPIILSTGLSDTTVGDHGDGNSGSITAYVYKPLVIKDLAQAIRRVLAQ